METGRCLMGIRMIWIFADLKHKAKNTAAILTKNYKETAKNNILNKTR